MKTVCCRSPDKKRDFEFDAGTTLTADPTVIVHDSDIDIVVEVMGGTDVAKQVVLDSLTRGKYVVTANKALLAEHLHEMIAHTRSNPDTRLCFEAAVGGGIPCIRAVQQTLVGDRFHQISGILNGTTNFMLSAMEADGVSYDAILKTAQEKGFAEADPTADVGGFDARAKIVLLARLAFNLSVDVMEVPVTGIQGVTAEDFAAAQSLGATIKLIGVAKPLDDSKLSVLVSPMVVPKSEPLAAVSGATNVVETKTEFLGTASFVGAGAGRFPTSNSVVADLVNIATGTATTPPFRGAASTYGSLATDFQADRWFLRFSVADVVGAPSKLATALGTASVGLKSYSVLPTTEADEADGGGGGGSGAAAGSGGAGTVTVVATTLPALKSQIDSVVSGAIGGVAIGDVAAYPFYA